ncbi:MAG: phosphatase PAP2 family protein [bacterium]
MKRISTLLKSKSFLIIVLLLLGICVGLLTKSRYYYSTDLQISLFIQRKQPFWFIDLMRLISLFEFAIVLLVIPLFIFFYLKKEKYAAYLILAAGLSWFMMRLLKVSFNIPCPTASEVQILFTFKNLATVLSTKYHSGLFNPNVCYPSGHVFDYIVLWGVILNLRDKITKSTWQQKLIKFFCIFIIFAVGISRISLGAHFFSDILGGYLFGSAWLLLLISIYRKQS